MDYHKLIDGVIIKVRNNIFKNNIIIFFILGNNIPAPNAYNIKGLTGINFNSKYRSSKMISMSQKFRYKDSRERYPGPGQYIRFSEFGILVSKKAREAKAILEEKKNEQKNKNTKTEANENVETSGKMETHAETKPLQTE